MSLWPMFPLGSVLLPGERLPLHIFEPRYQELLAACLAMEDPSFGVVLIARGKESGGGDVRHHIATAAHIISHEEVGDGRHYVECVGSERLRIDAWLEDDPYPRADLRVWADENAAAPPPESEFESLQDKISQLYALIGELARAEGAAPPPDPSFSALPAEAGERLFTLAAQVPMGQADRQDVLEAPGPSERLRVLVDAVDNVTDIVKFRLT